ncbi:hypothetical protein [Sorangium cellulosum]|uniref:hypothetical protein n=1 Tax=Sorangium cellulosum TaxID=56 RepID=UPI0002E4844F|nr:hypothetical protein [Sorangium cellulosum]
MSKRILYLCPTHSDIVICEEDADDDGQKLILSADAGGFCTKCKSRYYKWECERREVDK